jgi:hypothetical protein
MTSEPLDAGVAQVPRSPWLRWLTTNNPFYVLSAALFLAGLHLSCTQHADDLTAWGLMAGLAGYTLLLACTAFVLVRLGNVWDDVRTVVLLVVLMFLATSITFDEVLADNGARGIACYLVGGVFASVVSEGLIRGLRLAFPWPVRVPYYLFLALFFGYPLVLSPILHDPDTAAWGLFGFSTVAGVVLLTLLPAVWRGANLCPPHPAPWRWPLYPWVLFGLLAAAIPVRAFLLCWTLHFLDRAEGEQTIFGSYFLVPFAFAGLFVGLEASLTARSGRGQRVALLAPLGVLLLPLLSPPGSGRYQQFLTVFTHTSGADPLAWTVGLLAVFYAYACARRVAGALDGLMAALLLAAILGPQPLTQAFTGPTPMPLAVAALVQLIVGVRNRNSGRCMVGVSGLVAAGALLPFDGSAWERTVLAFHLLTGAALLVGGGLHDRLAHPLRTIGTAALVGAGGLVLGWPDERLPLLVRLLYPLALVVIVGSYAWWLQHGFAARAAATLAGLWLVLVGSSAYRRLRAELPGLDYLAASLALFGLAFLVSAAKAGRLPRWLRRPPNAG